jgi:hypothetical protein
MKHFKEVTETRTIFDKATCDRCKKDIPPDYPGYGQSNDGANDELFLKWNTLNDWFDGPCHNIEVDLCRECRVWLFRLLEKEGVELRGKDGKI